jgi:uncharacterized protein (TIGR02996 family)
VPRLRSGHDHWEIAQDGAKLVIVDGGKQTTRKFVSPTHAKVQHDKLVAEKLAAGFELTDEPAPVIEAGEPREPSLDAALLADPYDVNAAAVYGDWYQSRGHPRGELIALQIAEARDGKDMSPATRKHLVRHKEPLLGSLAAYDQPGESSPYTWRLGFIRKLDIADADSAVELVRAVLAHPSGRFLCEARLRFSDGDAITATLDALRPAKLRELSVLTYARLDRIDAIASFLQLRSLAIKCFRAAPSRNAIAAIAHMPSSVEAIDILLDGDDGDDDGEWPALAPLFARDDLRVTSLAMGCARFARDAMRALAEGPIAAGIVKLAIADQPEAWVTTLREHRDRFGKLEVLKVWTGLIAPHALAALRGSVKRVLDHRGESDLALLQDPDEDHFDEVRE